MSVMELFVPLLMSIAGSLIGTSVGIIILYRKLRPLTGAELDLTRGKLRSTEFSLSAATASLENVKKQLAEREQQIAAGEENRLSIRLYGSRAGLEWHQEEPNTLLYKVPGRPWERLRTGQIYLSPAARAASRLPPGHPEGYLEAFASLYRSFMEDVRRLQRGEAPLRDYPGVHEGVRGLRFVTQAVASSQAGGVWRDL